ncbi:homogentisate 1,2-dioxygenase [Sphingopyxis panaciterrae]
MPRHFLVTLAGLALIAPMSSALAEELDCTTGASALPPELADWASRNAVTAAVDATFATAAPLAIGRAADAALKPSADVKFAVTPGKTGEGESNAGLLAFTVETAGSYRVALGAGAWVDVAKDGAALVSTAHGHGPQCSGIRKMVDFSLTPGTYLLQIAASPKPSIAVMIAKLP